MRNREERENSKGPDIYFDTDKMVDLLNRLSQRKMTVLVNGNKFEIDRQQHNSTSNFVSANSLIANFIRYDASFIASFCINASD